MAVKHLAFRQALGARRHHILLADLVEEGVFRQQRGGGEGRQRHRRQRQRQVPEIIDDARRPGKLVPVVGDEAAQREPVVEGAAGEQHHQQDREQESRNGVGDDDDAARPYVEGRAVLDRLADAERDRDQIGDQRDPQAERDRHRHLLKDQVDHRDVAEIAVAEVEAGIVPQHLAEAFERRLVEAELLFQPGDELGIESLRAPIFGTAGAAARSLRNCRRPYRRRPNPAGRRRRRRPRSGWRSPVRPGRPARTARRRRKWP